MDLEMPIKDGLTASKQIRDDINNPNRGTPIIALTANATSLAQSTCAEAGMNLYLTKPLNAMDLMFSIAALKPFELYQLQYCPHILLYAGHTSVLAVPPEL
jgi:CheY-like chemotaxis protein